METTSLTPLTAYKLYALNYPIDEMDIKKNKKSGSYYVRVKFTADIELNGEKFTANCRANFSVPSDNPVVNLNKYDYIKDRIKNTEAQNIYGKVVNGTYNGTQFEYVELKFRSPFVFI